METFNDGLNLKALKDLSFEYRYSNKIRRCFLTLKFKPNLIKTALIRVENFKQANTTLELVKEPYKMVHIPG